MKNNLPLKDVEKTKEMTNKLTHMNFREASQDFILIQICLKAFLCGSPQEDKIFQTKLGPR